MEIRRARRLVLRGALAALAVVPALVACRTSPPPRTIPHATSPYGEQISVTLKDNRSFVGELLAVSDSSLMLMVHNRVAFARAGAISAVRASRFALRYSDAAGPPSKELEKARRGARYPYGISPEVLAALLAKTSQSSPVDLATAQQ